MRLRKLPCIQVKRGKLFPCEGLENRTDVFRTLLQLIPLGKVISYGELAKVFGTGPRAVGYWLKKNDSPIIVPCHRVVRSDGSLGGYTFGGKLNPEFKRRLLELEGVKFQDSKIAKECFFKLSSLLEI